MPYPQLHQADVLCAANYPANTGYAWDFIETLYARVADALAPQGVLTVVAYPSATRAPRTLAGSSAVPVVLDAGLRTWQSVWRTARFVRLVGVRVIYFTDRPAWSLRYAILRAAGIRWVVVHRHNAGGRDPSRGLRRWVKGIAARVPWVSADVVVTVSDYVSRMQIATSVVPARRLIRVWNGISAVDTRPGESARSLLGVPADRVLFACACRAAPVKGVARLFRAFERVSDRWPAGIPRPALVYIGDGPEFSALKELRAGLRARDSIFMTGYRADAVSLLADADACITASIGPDALPLSVLQPMAMAKAVIASRVGGIPEMIEDGVTGLLVPPGDEERLADAMLRLGTDPELARRLGSNARTRVTEHFSPDQQISRLAEIVRRGLRPENRERRVS